MKRNNFWKWILVVFVLAWAVYEIYPPTGKDLYEVFEDKARSPDQTYSNIMATARELRKKLPDRDFGNLKEAIGNADIAKYFPDYDVSKEKNPTRAILNHLQREAAGKIKLGIDLQGGTSFLVGLDTNQLDQLTTNQLYAVEEKQRVVTEAIEVLRKRVDRFGVAEPILQPEGNDRILIVLPGLSEVEKQDAEETIKKAAFLEFRLVHPESDEMVLSGQMEPGYTNLAYPHPHGTSGQMIPHYLVKKTAERGLTGKYVKNAMAIRDPVSNEPKIILAFDSKGAELFGEITRDNVKRHLAIVLDGVLYSAPSINEPILGGRAEITGSFDLKEAITLQNVLENPLETPVSILQTREVDPSLGKDAIRSGMMASIIAAAATFCFMFIFYFFVGFIANFALALNVVILLGVMCSIGTTMTLPGIAGIALTIGMAVDANVLIYERLREEMAAGKSLRAAVAAAYSKAFGTIFDSNLTTLISALILVWMGAGPIKGFGVTLAIGLCVHMFTALVFTRLVFDFLLDRNLIKTIRILPVIKGTKIDFLRWAKPAFIACWLIIAIGVGYGVKRGKDVLGIDFRGGDSLTLTFTNRVEVDRLRDMVGKLNVGEPRIQYQRDIAQNKETLSLVTDFKAGERVVQELSRVFPEAGFNVIGAEKVGATIGKEITESAFLAALLAMCGILVYVAFRYEFSFAVAAVVAGAHDVLLTVGIYVMLGREFNTVFVAAVLTIIGYSINDKIVILDRIREDLKLGVRGSFKELINIALNQTLSRTMITGGSVMLATLSLLVFGGGALKDFAIAFLTGTLVGTLSSIFIAAPIVHWWHKGERPKTGTPQAFIDNSVTARV